MNEKTINLLGNHKRLLTSVLFENKPFEDVFASDREEALKRVRIRVCRIFENVVYSLYMRSIEEREAVVRTAANKEKKQLRTILYIDNNLYDSLFGKYIKEQQLIELAKLINLLIVEIAKVDWIEFVLGIEED